MDIFYEYIVKRKKETKDYLIIAGIIASFIPFVREKDGLWTVIAGITPFLVFLMYLESTASRTVKAFFFNCDISLLKYGYYREKNAILENFKIRTKYLIKLALIPSFILSIGIIIITVLCGHSTDLHIAIPIAITILLLSIFFAMFHLLLYYYFFLKSIFDYYFGVIFSHYYSLHYYIKIL